MTSRRLLRVAAPAVLILAVLVIMRAFDSTPTIERDGLTFASPELAAALDGSTNATRVRVLAAFEDARREPCRAFVAAELSAIACQEPGGWHLRVIRDGVSLDQPAELAATEAALRQAAARMQVQ